MIVVNYHKRPEGQESEIYQIRRSYAQISRNQSLFTLSNKKSSLCHEGTPLYSSYYHFSK